VVAVVVIVADDVIVDDDVGVGISGVVIALNKKELGSCNEGSSWMTVLLPTPALKSYGLAIKGAVIGAVVGVGR
jgi:hypothetical protein